MVHPSIVKQQLRELNAEKSFFCSPERRELPQIMIEGEQLLKVLDGRYSGGMAMLCATNMRILLVDKKPFFMAMEDIRYEMISDVLFQGRLINSTMTIGTLNNTIAFTSFNRQKSQEFTALVQQKVIETRNIAQNLSDFQAQQFGQGNQAGSVSVRNPYNMPVMIKQRAPKYF